MEPYIQRWVQRAKTPAARVIIPSAIVLAAAVAFTFFAGNFRVDTTVGRGSAGTMIILRGIANSENPRGQLDDESALEYARRLGYRGEVLDVAGDNSGQVRMALDRIRGDENVTAIYGFSGGGYNAKRIWGELNAAHVESGLAGIWNDMNEPATGNIPAGRMRFGHGADAHERFHNQYALLMAMEMRAPWEFGVRLTLRRANWKRTSLMNDGLPTSCQLTARD